MSDSIEDKKNIIKKEIEKLRHEYKIELPKVIAKARSFGDLKENSEYHAARERHSFVKAKISQLNQQLSQLMDINTQNISEDKVDFGSTIVVLDRDTNQQLEFTIVSAYDVNPSEGKISFNSPVGSAFKDKTAGDEVEAKIPAGTKKYYIEKLTTINGNVIEA